MFRFLMNNPPYVVCENCGIRWVQEDIRMKLKGLTGFPVAVNALKCSECGCTNSSLDFSDVRISIEETEEGAGDDD